MYTGGTCNNFKKVCSQFLKFNWTQDAICVQKVEEELVKKWKFRQNTWFLWNRRPFHTYKILILRWISIYILAINTNKHSKASRRVSNNIPSGLTVPLINYAVVWFLSDLKCTKRNQNDCKISALVRKTVFWRALNQDNINQSTRLFVDK